MKKKQEEQVRRFIDEKMDVIITIPVDTKRTTEITNMARKSKTPIIYINKFPEEFEKGNLPNGVYYVGSDDKSAGVIQMEFLCEQLNGKGDIVVLMGDFRNLATFQRTQGVEEVADKYPEIKIIEKKSAKFLSPLAKSIVEEWLDSGLKFDAIVANNDIMAIGAIRALEKYKKETEIKVVGIDLIEEAIPELKSGKLTATVFQNALEQGKKGIEYALQLGAGEQVQNEKWIPFELVSTENYMEFIND